LNDADTETVGRNNSPMQVWMDQLQSLMTKTSEPSFVWQLLLHQAFPESATKTLAMHTLSNRWMDGRLGFNGILSKQVGWYTQ